MEEQDQPAARAKGQQKNAAGRKNGPRAGAVNRKGGRGAKANAAGSPPNQQAAANDDEVRVRKVKPVAKPARMRRRHWGVIVGFLLLVVLPSAITWWYLHARAADQFASTIGFSVRKEEASSSADLLGNLTGGSSDSSKDTDILYEFIQSQKMVELVDAQLDLKTLFSKYQDQDPIFAYHSDGSIEDLLGYWSRMVKVFYDGGNGLIQVRVQAFTANDAQQIAQSVFDESSLMINRLSDISRLDTTRYAQEELSLSIAQLKIARQAVTAFRSKAQIVDPNADIQAQMGLLNTLQQQLASALIELDLLRDTARETDPRIEQANRKIVVIEARIADERKKFSVGGDDGNGTAYATLINEYEGLIVERQFAEQTYLAAQTALNSAKAEAQRKSRYLAAYVEPTLAETAQYPKRLMLFGLITLFIFVIWSILVLVFYSIKDRR